MKRLILPLLFPLAANAQVNCADLQLDSLAYSAFSTSLQVRIHNNSSEFISYPKCDVIDANGDTLIHALAQTFGIIEGTSQLHTMAMTFPVIASPFTGTIALHYTTVEGDFVCDFVMDDVDLCPPAPCGSMLIYAYGLGGPVNAYLAWTVIDDEQNVVVSGDLELSTLDPSTVIDTLCLAPGLYTLNVLWPFPSGEQIMVGLTTDLFLSASPSGVVGESGDLVIPFVYQLYCINGTQGVVDHSIIGPRVHVVGSSLEIVRTDRSPIGAIAIIDSMGRTVRAARGSDERLVIDLAGASAGSYLVRAIDASWPTQRFNLN